MRHHESESHQRDTRANPGEKRSLFGEIIPQVSHWLFFDRGIHVDPGGMCSLPSFGQPMLRDGRSARPGRVEYDAAEVGGLEALVLEGQHVIVDGAERAVRTMLHPIVEGPDDIVLE